MDTIAGLERFLGRIRILMPSIAITQQSYTHALYDQILKNHLIIQSMRNKQLQEQQPEQQVPENNLHGPLGTIHNIRKISLHLYRFLLYINIFLFVKYITIEVLNNSGLLQSYRIVDCFLLGRFRFIGRTNRISSWMALWALTTFLCMQLVNAIPISRSFRFHFIEFLWYDFDQVARIESSYLKMEAARKSRRWPEAARKGKTFTDGPCMSPDLHEWTLGAGSHQSAGPEIEFNPLFHIKADHGQIILRPNRTTECWLKFEWLTRFIFVALMISFASWVILLTWLISGSLLTTTGFELAYSSCVKWLRDEQRRDPESSVSIYRAPSKLADEIPFDLLPTVITVTRENLSSFSFYNSLRILVDVTESYLIYLEFTLACWFTFYLVLCASIDVINNAQRIKVITLKLLEHFRKRYYIEQARAMLFRKRDSNVPNNKRLLAKLARERNLADWPRPMGSPLAFSYPLEPSLVLILDDDEERLESEIDYLQAILVDHFKLIHSYNTFVSYVLNLPIGCWISYTIIICIWMGRIRHMSVDAEFKIAQIGALVTTFLVMFTAVIARSHNRELYPLISTLMALDLHRVVKKKQASGQLTSRMLKFRWISIMKFYFPKPTFCFTLYGSTEVSWLFCVKLASWIMSVFLVLANFFYSFQYRFGI